MIVLLAPSASKTPGSVDRPVDVDSLWAGDELGETRRRVGNALVDVSLREDALSVLKVGPRVADMVADNVDLWQLPTGPAAKVYSGVLYDGMGASQWDDATIERAGASVFVQSALWGLVSVADMIPAYRLSMDVELPGVGRLAPVWKQALAEPMTKLAAGQVVLDCRSGSYQRAWKPSAAVRRQAAIEVVDVRAVRVDESGREKTVSHWAKYYRGVIAGRVVEVGAQSIEDVSQLAPIVEGLDDIVDYRIEVGSSSSLTLVVD